MMKAQYLHRVDKLETQDAWALLKKQVVLNESDEADVGRLKDAGIRIVERCDGLPLAVKVLGGLLLNTSRTRDAWVDVSNHVTWSMEGMDDDINKAVYLSYEELPSHLKQCFLFCSLFPKDELIRSGVISQLWIAEGYIQNKLSSKPPEDVAFEYYKELISRNLLEPVKGSYDHSACTLHDVVRSFAQYITKDETVLISEGQDIRRTIGTSISTIPQGIGDLKFLQALDLCGCTNITQLPNSMLKLRKQRSLNFRRTAITSVPRGFGKLEDLVFMGGFPSHSDGSADGWCSLEELGPLSKLKRLDIIALEKAPSGSMAAKAMLSSKHHLTVLDLIFTSRLGENGEVEDDISKEDHMRIEEVLANLCPPTCIEELDIKGYFALGLPWWMRTMSVFGSLRRLQLDDYACCTQLPNGLGQLPFLNYFWVHRAPSVQFVRHDFLHPSLGGESDGQEEAPLLKGIENKRRHPHHILHGAGVAFAKLVELGFVGMPEWTEWEWKQHVPAMPALQELMIRNCKLQHLPAGLAHHACRLRDLDLRNVQQLISVENFPSLVNFWSYDNPRLERISNNPSLQWIEVCNCRALKELDGLPSLRSLEWWDWVADALPQYLREANLKKLRVDCSRSLLKLIALQDESSEWGKIKHVMQLKAYGHKTGEEEEWYIYYTKEPYSFDAYLGESTTGITQECRE
ncbi:putative disease resistance protein RGA3 [Panicum virgatum]|uniref:putative disease resistance protein RGA3 n=1 Tax=Panicum virgatum TaxID=38727 RepID=UPI0019D621D6|nr:putative disease resistance protein RGA3 [Panicum virgatum]